jgi:hypothetical protein
LEECHCFASFCDYESGVCDPSIGGNKYGCANGWIGQNCQVSCSPGIQTSKMGIDFFRPSCRQFLLVILSRSLQLGGFFTLQK